MGRGKNLTDYEKGKIDQLVSLKWSERKIAAELGRSRTAIHGYIFSSASSREIGSPGRKKALGPRTIKAIIGLASNKTTSCGKIKDALELKVSKPTVWRILGSSQVLKYSKMKGNPLLTQEHKNTRFNFALNHVQWAEQWSTVVFTDEKKFNLDGPDGYKYYWHDIRQEPINFSRRVQGGGSVMVWAGFGKAGKTPLYFIETTMNSSGYCTVLQNVLIPFGLENYGNNYIFQQDNAGCHRAKNTKNWLESKGIGILEWPSRSPDLNPVENLWGILARKVYEGGKQYNYINELKTALIFAWDAIEEEELKALISSMPNRMIEVLKNQGGAIDY